VPDAWINAARQEAPCLIAPFARFVEREVGILSPDMSAAYAPGANCRTTRHNGVHWVTLGN
jgi:hypothetical protein